MNKVDLNTQIVGVFVCLDPRTRQFMRCFIQEEDAVSFFKAVFPNVPDYILEDCVRFTKLF